MQTMLSESHSKEVAIPSGMLELKAELTVPMTPAGLVILIRQASSAPQNALNRKVSRTFQENNFGTLLFDLPVVEQDQSESRLGSTHSALSLSVRRLVDATKWATMQDSTRHLPIGYFGLSAGAATALMAAAELHEDVSAVVSCGGQPDMVGEALQRITAPTLLLVGGRDIPLVVLNERAAKSLRCMKSVMIVPRASRFFQEPGALSTVARLSSEWFLKQLRRGGMLSQPLDWKPHRSYWLGE